MLTKSIQANNLELWENDTQLETIKRVFGKDLTNEEFSFLINIGKATGLNPFLREIWAVKYDSKAAASIFIGRDGYRKSAHRHPNYEYHIVDAVYSNDEFTVKNGFVIHQYKAVDRGILVGAYCSVKKRDSNIPSYVFVELKEYDSGFSLWKTKKSTMIKKVAEAQGLRMAFQELFAGTYSEEEFDAENRIDHSQGSKKISELIEGKYQTINPSNANDNSQLNTSKQDLLDKIKDATELHHLLLIAEEAKKLREEDKKEVREKYAEKESELRKKKEGKHESKTENKQSNEDFLKEYDSNPT